MGRETVEQLGDERLAFGLGLGGEETRAESAPGLVVAGGAFRRAGVDACSEIAPGARLLGQVDATREGIRGIDAHGFAGDFQLPGARRQSSNRKAIVVVVI